MEMPCTNFTLSVLWEDSGETDLGWWRNWTVKLGSRRLFSLTEGMNDMSGEYNVSVTNNLMYYESVEAAVAGGLLSCNQLDIFYAIGGTRNNDTP